SSRSKTHLPPRFQCHWTKTHNRHEPIGRWSVKKRSFGGSCYLRPEVSPDEPFEERCPRIKAPWPRPTPAFSCFCWVLHLMLGPDGRFKILIFTIQNSVSLTSHILSRRFSFYTIRWDRVQAEVDQSGSSRTSLADPEVRLRSQAVLSEITETVAFGKAVSSRLPLGAGRFPGQS